MIKKVSIHGYCLVRSPSEIEPCVLSVGLNLSLDLVQVCKAVYNT